MKRLAPPFRAADARGVRAVFTDFDGTLTTDGKLLASTYASLERLARAGVPVVIVTGRPAGWGESMVRSWPVAAVVTENGGVTFLGGQGGAIERVYGLDARTLPATRKKMHAAAARVARRVPGARLSSDSRYTEVDLAIDWNEEVHLAPERAREIEALLRKAGFNAVRSSVHVNFWPGTFDKLSACRHVVRRLLGGAPLHRFVYVGDALNDEPMFGGFPRSIGVRGIEAVWSELVTRPAFLTVRDGGLGFEEMARAIRAAR